MQGYVYQSDFFRKNIAKWRRDGRKQGMEKGMKEGMKEGMREGMKEGVKAGKQEAAVAVAREKLGDLSEADLTAIRSIQEESALTDLLVALARAPSARSARAALAKAQKRA